MNDIDRAAYAKYRLEKSWESYDSAVLLTDNKRWNAAINRFYHGCFYAVSALLVTYKIESKSHSGIKTQFFLNFVKTSKVSMETGKLYGDLFDWRQKGDYGDFFDFEEADVLPLVALVKEFLDCITKLLHN